VSVASRQRKRKIILPGATQAGGGLVLPGGVRPGGRTLHVPAGYDDGPLVGKCLVPGCGQVFYSGQEEEWQKHVGWCAKRNVDAIREVIAERKKRQAVFQPENWDPEVREHMDKVGKRMKAEGRLTVKPNERAGF
jgi:hypothetical protein